MSLDTLQTINFAGKDGFQWFFAKVVPQEHWKGTADALNLDGKQSHRAKIRICGYDTFDCVSPTRIARHGIMLSRINSKGINLNNSKFKNDHSLLDDECDLSEINIFTKSYLHHLFKSNEILGIVILSLYNIWFMNKFFEDIRTNIESDTFEKFKKNFFDNLTK